MIRPLALLLVLACPAVAAAQPTRFDVLRGLLRYHGVTTVLEDDPDPTRSCRDLVVVVTGPVPNNRNLRAACQRCLLDGGAVLIATDDPADLSGFFPGLPGIDARVGVDGGPVRAIDPADQFGDNRFRPILHGGDLQLAANLFPGIRKPFIANKSAVVDLPTNARFPRLFVPLLTFRKGCRDIDGQEVGGKPAVVIRDPQHDAAVPGSAVAAANTAIFGNELATLPGPAGGLGTDNFGLTFFVSKYLVVAGDRKRTRCLFLEGNTIVTDFDTVPFAPVTPPVPPLPPLDQLQQKLVEEANRAVGEWQDRDGPTRALIGDGSGPAFRNILTGLAVAAAVLAAMLVFKAWRRAKLPTDLPRRPPPPIDDPDSGLDQLADAGLRTNNLGEPARAHLRALFAGWGATGDRLPKIAFSGGGRQELGEALHHLWRVAHDRPNAVVTAADWKEMRGMIEDVSRAAAGGRWRFVPTGGAA